MAGITVTKWMRMVEEHVCACACDGMHHYMWVIVMKWMKMVEQHVCVCVSVTVRERERDILKKYPFHMTYNIHHYMWVIVVKWMTIAEECVCVCVWERWSLLLSRMVHKSWILNEGEDSGNAFSMQKGLVFFLKPCLNAKCITDSHCLSIYH